MTAPARRALPLTEALAAALLGTVLVACVLAGHGALVAARQDAARLQQALVAADGAARLAALHGGDPATRDRELAALQRKHGPILRQLFVVGAGGVDDFGIARGNELVFGAQLAGAAGPQLLERTKAVAAAGEAALRDDQPIDAARLQASLADGAVVLAVPYRAAPDAPDIAGVAGAVLKPVPAAPTPPWAWATPLLMAALVLGLLRFSPLPAAGVGVAGLLLGMLGLLAALPGVPAPVGAGVTVLASAQVVPHGALELRGAAAGLDTWLYGGTAALALVLGLCVPGLGGVLRALRKDPAPYAYVGPAILATALLVFVPFAVGMGLSFVDRGGAFIGLDNYVEVIASALDPASSTHFFRTFGMTVLWTGLNVAMHVTLGLGLALVLNRPKLRGRALYRLLLVVPWAVPSYITALTWKWLFNTQYGPINAMLGLVGVGKVDWLGDSTALNFLANLGTNVWLGFPFMMVISLGALQSIPGELYEAADIDGASGWQKFRHVTLPLLRPALFPAVILGTIWTFNAFNVIYLVSGGGPDHTTDILITEAYYTFSVLRRTGLAAAYSVLIFLLLLGYTLLTNRKTKATEAVTA